VTAWAGVGTARSNGPANDVVENQNRTPAAVQQVGRLAASSRTTRTGRHVGSDTESTAKAMPAANQPKKDGSHRSICTGSGRAVHTQISQATPSNAAAPSAARTRTGRSGRGPESRASPAPTRGSRR
jgi:hypothetical protein